MCARFVASARYSEIKAEFGIEDDADIEENEPSYNVAPGTDVLAITNGGGKHLVRCRWGLLPPWDARGGHGMINARAETIDGKKSFSGPFMHHRCIVPADGFYEWRKEGGRSLPYYFRLTSHRLMGLAGIISPVMTGGRELLTLAIVTTGANDVVSKVHERMPALISGTDRERWLDPAFRDMDELKGMLAPSPAGEMESYAVSSLVNSPRNNSPENIRPA